MVESILQSFDQLQRNIAALAAALDLLTELASPFFEPFRRALLSSDALLRMEIRAVADLIKQLAIGHAEIAVAGSRLLSKRAHSAPADLLPAVASALEVAATAHPAAAGGLACAGLAEIIRRVRDASQPEAAGSAAMANGAAAAAAPAVIARWRGTAASAGTVPESVAKAVKLLALLAEPAEHLVPEKIGGEDAVGVLERIEKAAGSDAALRPKARALLDIARRAKARREELKEKEKAAAAEKEAKERIERLIAELRAAAIDNNYGKVKDILKEAGDKDIAAVIDKRDDRGRTPLQDACRAGAAEAVRVLIEHNANTDNKDNNGYTALHGMRSREPRVQDSESRPCHLPAEMPTSGQVFLLTPIIFAHKPQTLRKADGAR